jgi:hypothetical protein
MDNLSSPNSSPVNIADVTTINAAQSIFEREAQDPWAIQATEDLVDLLVWTEQVTFPIVRLRGQDIQADRLIPRVAKDLIRREPESFRLDVKLLDEPRELASVAENSVLDGLTKFLANNPRRVQGFMRLHNSPWITSQIVRSNSGSHLVYDLGRVVQSTRGREIATRASMSLKDLEYLIDLILKYFIYAEIAAGGGSYLSHPIRSLQSFSFVRPVAPIGTDEKKVPFRLGPALTSQARKEDADWLTARIHMARQYVREHGMLGMASEGAIEKDVLDEFGRNLGLPVHIRGFEQIRIGTKLVGAGAGLSGSLISASPWPAVAGCTVALTEALWAGQLPQVAARIRWLRWLMESSLVQGNR